jgi:hypothetical protein
VVTGNAPGRRGVGELYMQAVFELADFPLAFAILSPRRVGGNETMQMLDVPVLRLTRRFEAPLRVASGLLGGLSAWAGVRFALASHVRKLARQLQGFATEVRADRAVFILDSPTTIMMAARFAESGGVPMHTLVWDMPRVVLADHGHAGAAAEVVLSDFARAMRASHSVAVMSDAMKQRLGEQFGVRGVVLRQPSNPEWRRDVGPVSTRTDGRELVLGFAGSVTAREELNLLLQALDDVGWRIEGKPVRLRMTGLRYTFTASSPRLIEYLGYLADTPNVVSALASCDLLFLPQPFAPARAEFARYSFPTKAVTYLAAGRPILLFAPTDSSLHAFFAERGLPLLCVQNDAVSLLQALSAFERDRARFEAQTPNYLRVVEQELGQPACRRQLAEFLEDGTR